MNQLTYGVWDGKVYDFRNGSAGAEEAMPTLFGLDDFAPDNTVLAFVADRGFLVFDPAVSLVETFWMYMQRASEESCGKCTPCRVGTSQLRDELDAMRQGRGDAGRLGAIALLAEQIATTSLCGLGQSCSRALQSAIAHFKDVFEQEIAAGATRAQHGMVYATAPCIEACPAKLDVPHYIDDIRDGKPSHALGIILDKYPMASSCGRVCVRFCELACRRKDAEGAVGIKMLKRFAADQAYTPGASLFSKELVRPQLDAPKRVAVVGAGPAGITCAYQLLRNGVDVDVFDSQHKAGGMTSVGIPSYRLPKDVLKSETEDAITQLGGRMLYGKALGRDYSVGDLLAQGYDSVFLGYGASRGTLLGVKDEDPTLKGYYSGIDFLKDVHDHVEDGKPFSLDGEVVVVGGGNVAMDCVRSAVRMGARKVHLVYRRTVADMPADHEEIEASEKEGVVFHCLTNPSRLMSEDGVVCGVEVVQMRQTEMDAKGRRSVEAVDGSESVLKCSYVIAAIGQQVDRATLSEADGVATDRWGCIVADPDTLTTSREAVFAGGDCVLGPLTLIHAMDQGAKAAASITEYLKHGTCTVKPEQRMQRMLAASKLVAGECLDRELVGKDRFTMPELDVAARVNTFDEVEQVITQEEAYREADRCLRCYRLYSVITEAPLATQTQYA